MAETTQVSDSITVLSQINFGGAILTLQAQKLVQRKDNFRVV
jgi:hypothetical protein